MRSRRLIYPGAIFSLAAITVAVALTANGQEGTVAEPKYYQGKVSPPPPGLFNNGGARPPAQNPNLSYPAPSVPTPSYPAPSPTPPAVSNPPASNYPSNFTLPAGQLQPNRTAASPQRLTQPVVAGPEGVRQASASEPGGTPPFFTTPKTPLAPSLAPPSVNVEAPVMPDPKVLSNATPGPFNPEIPAPAPVAAEQPTVNGVTPTNPQPVLPTVQPGGPAPLVAKPTTVAPPKSAFQEQPATLPNSIAPNTAAFPSRQAPNITIEALAPEAIGVGQSLSYELVVRNVGTAAVTNVRIEDELPTRTQFLGSEPAAETAGDRLSWTIGTMEAGTEKRIKVTVKPLEEGEIRSRATVSFSSTVEARLKVTRPKITVAMTGPETTRVGEKVPFQIKLANTGTGTAGRILLKAQFSDGLLHSQGQIIEAELANLPAGQTKTLNLEVTAGKSGTQACVVTAIADGIQTETAKSSVTLVEPMLTIKQAGPARCLVKGEPTYTIELTNPGTATTDSVQLWAALPPGFDFLQATDGGAFLEANRAIGWRLPGLPAGTTKTVSLKLKAVAPTEGVIRTVAQTNAMNAEQGSVTNTGIITVENRTPSSTRGLEARTETIVKAEGVPALRFEVQDIEDPVEVGKEAVYEIRVVNQGTGPCTNVQIVADMAETTMAVGSTGPTNGKIAGQQIIFEPIAQFGVKAEAVFRVRVKGTQPGDFRFRVRMTCDQIRSPVIKEENTRFYKE